MFKSVKEAAKAGSELVRLSDEKSEQFTDDGDPIIDFMIQKELYGAIEEPYPATKNMPDWYKSASSELSEEHLGGNNVASCVPFFDSLTTGWIIPVPVDIEVSIDKETNHMNFDWESDIEFVDAHSRETLTKHFPDDHKLALQIYHKWAWAVPDGYSVLMTEPFNRMETRWKAMTGMVDADEYMGPVNGSLIWQDFEYEGIIKAGTPLFQVIPFKRDSLITEGRVRERTDEEELEVTRTTNKVLNKNHYYKNHAWSNSRKARNIPNEDVEDSKSGCPFH
jgi:hypothetical protein